ncbi:MAG: sigma 54-interacting transcriptional regulator [Polyangiaceae bacterium]
MSSYDVPDSGELVVGRDERADVCLHDPLVSRQHVRILLGPAVEVEDLGSGNGTRLRGARVTTSPDDATETETQVEMQLSAGGRATWSLGQPMLIGTTTLVLQARDRFPTPPAVRSRRHFDAQLAALLAEVHPRPLSVVVLATGSGAAKELEEQMLRVVPGSAIVASPGAGQFEVLLAGDAQELDALLRKLALRLGARFGSAVHPEDGASADLLVRVARERAGLAGTAEPSDAPVVASSAMQKTLDLARRAAASTLSVLLLGETGTGKEVVAEVIHRASTRSACPLLKLNCAALPEALLESELFGHERGAFTGAVATKAGLLESAHGGTVFLDEIGELPAPLQAKLLRVLEDRSVRRLGSSHTRTLDVRFVAATHRNLQQVIASGGFREDLFYRLAGVVVTIPPLRERPEDIDRLAAQFASAMANDLGRPTLTFSRAAEDALRRHAWPGNVRELRNVVERAVVLARGDRVEVDDLQLTSSAPENAAPRNAEHAAILRALAECGGNQTRAAQILGISRRTLTSRLTLYDVVRPRK